jgi:hypothetical protein
MSLLEKAISGKTGEEAPRAARTSLFARAVAANREAETEPPSSIEIPVDRLFANEPASEGRPLSLDRLDEFQRLFDALPPRYDSLISAWSFAIESLPLDAMALFIPKGEFLSLAASIGFPAGTDEPLPASIAPARAKPCESLGSEARAIAAPVLGLSLGASLRATSVWADSSLAGLWVYHDDRLDSASQDELSEIEAALARSFSKLHVLMMAVPAANPARDIMETARKFASASIFRLDLPDGSKLSDPLRSVALRTMRSATLAACRDLLAQSGSALAFGESSVACMLGSASSADPDLSLFQFSKTLRRVLPFLSQAAFPSARALLLDPASDRCLGDLTAFLAE